MGHPIWQPFGRLSYTAYLCHLFIIYYLWNLQDRPLHFDGIWSQFIQATLPVVVMAYTFAFFWSCLCEIPFLKLEKMLFDAILPKKNIEKRVNPESQNRWSDWSYAKQDGINYKLIHSFYLIDLLHTGTLNYINSQIYLHIWTVVDLIHIFLVCVKMDFRE